MLKKLLYIVLLPASLIVSVSSCTEWLTLKPESEIVSSDYWKTESDVTQFLAGCYLTMTNSSVIYRMVAWGELRSDNMLGTFSSSQQDLQRIVDGDITPTNSYASWATFYSVINNCNILLKNAPKVVALDQNFSENDLKRVTAEAKAIRALCYFYLVRTFNDVPYVTVPSETEDQDYELPKTSGEVVLDSLASDLETVKDWASTNLGLTSLNKGRFTRDGVYTLLADIYLWQQKYDLCVQRCNSVLQDKDLTLINYKDFFSSVFYKGNSQESVFELQFKDLTWENNAIEDLYGYSTGTKYISFPTTLVHDQEKSLTGLYSPFNYKITSTVFEGAKDSRATDSYYESSGKYYIFKYRGSDVQTVNGVTSRSFRTNTPNWIVYRKPDVILMKAEALAAKGDSASIEEAFSCVNTTYSRANNGEDLDRANYKSVAEIQKLVLRERHREFLFEGKRWFDLVRLARREKSVSTLNTYVNYKASGASATLGAPVLNAMYMPIAKSELQYNKKLKQNPYYEESGNSSSRN